MKPTKLYRRWKERLRDCQRSLKKEWNVCRRTGEEESIHRLRVLLRRARLFMRLGNFVLGKPEVAEFRQWSQRVSIGVGAVRDHDTTLAWVPTQREGPELAPALGRRRLQLWCNARRRLTKLRKLPLQGLANDPRRQHLKRLDSRFTKIFTEAREEVVGFKVPLQRCSTEEGHELRRDLRRLRYLRELSLSRKQQKRDRLLKLLVNLQEALGEAQNHVAAASVLAQAFHAAQTSRLRKRLEMERKTFLQKAERALRVLQRSSALKKVAD